MTSSTFKHIDIAGLKELMQGDVAKVFDIRDAQSFGMGRIPGAIHLHNENVQKIVTETSIDTPVVVCCYHGISSQQAADYLAQQGIEQVYSLDGGFEAWKVAESVETD